MIEKPILITGAARSGTSMTAGVIGICGAWGGEVKGSSQHNPKGFFENREIRNEVVKPILRAMGFDPLGQRPLPYIPMFKQMSDEKVGRIKKSILDIIKNQGYKGDIRWYYKGAKMCLMWPLWNRMFPEADWVIVRRDAEEIVYSCLKTSFMKAYKKRSGWLKWVAAHERRFEEMHDEKMKIREIWPSRMVNGDFTEMQSLINAYDLKWSQEKVVNFIDPGLWRKT